jgi:WD40 repeat protein
MYRTVSVALNALLLVSMAAASAVASDEWLIERTLDATTATSAFAFSSSSSELAVGDDVGRVRLFDVTSGSQPRLLDASGCFDFRALRYSADDSSIVALTADEVVVWDRQSGRIRRRFKFDTGTDRRVLVSQILSNDGQLLALGYERLRVRLFSRRLIPSIVVISVESGRVVREFADGPKVIAFAPDRHHLVARALGGVCRVLSVLKGGRISEFRCGNNANDWSSISPDGRYLAVADEPDGAFIVDMATGKRVT